MGKLSGRNIAVTGPRCEVEFTRMVLKMGGTPFICPAQGHAYSEDGSLAEQLRSLMTTEVDWLVLTTGIGTEALIAKAEDIGMKEELLSFMSKTRVAVRGYKTVNTLRKHQIDPAVKVEDGTTDGIFRELSVYPLQGARIALQLYGDPSPRISKRLRAAGAECIELLPYIHVMPESGPIDELIGRCLAGSIDAVVFTSTAQARCVFHRARVLGKEQPFLASFENNALCVAVGKVTADALHDEGVIRVIYPEEERLGPALVGAGRWFERRGTASDVFITSAHLGQ
jgi:uroporphyrinogen-III synthase